MDKGEWLTSRLDRFNSGKKAPVPIEYKAALIAIKQKY